jgi:hypothetical protein
MGHADIRMTMAYGTVFTPEMAQAHNKIVGLALNGTGIGTERSVSLCIGGRGRNRIINLTYFQQHAGRRMTS